jgi:AraC-like DNA-binding protein
MKARGRSRIRACFTKSGPCPFRALTHALPARLLASAFSPVVKPCSHPLFDFLAAQRHEAFEIGPRIDARRHLARQFDPELPLLLKIYSFPRYRRMVGEGWMHWHEYHELIVPVRGAGSFQVGDQVARFQPGDLLVVDNLKLHGVAELSGPHQSLVILFPAEFIAPTASVGADHGFLAPLCGRSEDVPPILRGSDRVAAVVHSAVLGIAAAYFSNAPVVDRFLSAKLQLLTVLYHLREHFGLRQDFQDEIQRRQQRQARLQKVFAWIAANHADSITQPQAAAVAGMSASRFRDFFKQTTGRTFVDYLRDVRLSRAAQMLRESDESIADVAAATGFADQSYLHRCFKARYGCAPFDYRRQIQMPVR